MKAHFKMRFFFFSFFFLPKSFAFYFVNDHPSLFLFSLLLLFRTKSSLHQMAKEKGGVFGSIRAYGCAVACILHMKKIMVRVKKGTQRATMR